MTLSIRVLMPIRKEVKELVSLGPLPSSDVATVESMRGYQELPASLRKLVTDEEARELVKLFGGDDCFGQTWTSPH